MNITYHTYNDQGVMVRYSVFAPSGGASEAHVMLTLPPHDTESFAVQLSRMESALRSLAERLPGYVPVMVRAFMSDGANQGVPVRAMLAGVMPDAALSLIEQPPLDGTKLSIWVYLRTGAEISRAPGSMEIISVKSEGSAMTHYYMGSAGIPDFGSEVATMTLIQDYAMNLENMGMTFADNCVRTWFYVRDVDTNYTGMVRGRNEVFKPMDLTPRTHFIASTGIGGRHADPRVTVQLDAYAIGGLVPGQQHYLYAKDNLNSTYEYGVAFERGVVVDYADRRHLIISGTASIDNRGAVVHTGDVLRQADRMLDNIAALLAEGGATLSDCCHFIIYLRDTADAKVVSELFDARFPNMPRVIVLAPVCRPGWLIETECMAIVERQSDYAPF